MLLKVEIMNCRTSVKLQNVHVPVLPICASSICFHNTEVVDFCKIVARNNVLSFLYLLTCGDSIVSI
jgi:hypothetical protein